MMFYLSNVAIAVNISQPSVRIGGDLHALIHIYFLHGGSKSPKPFCDLNVSVCLFVCSFLPHPDIADLVRYRSLSP
jgi:hypothetical protein